MMECNWRLDKMLSTLVFAALSSVEHWVDSRSDNCPSRLLRGDGNKVFNWSQ